MEKKIWTYIIICTCIIIYPLTMRVIGAPQMISQPVSSISACSQLPFGTWQTPGLSIPWCCLSTSTFVCLPFFLLSLCLARWFWPDLINGRHEHTTAVYVSLRWSSGLHVVRLLAGSWHRLPHWWHGFCRRCIVSSGSTSFPWFVFFFGALLRGSMIHHTSVHPNIKLWWQPIEKFNDQLQNVTDQTLKKDILVVQGDWNAKVDKDACENWQDTCGPFNSDDTNERGLTLLEFAAFNDLVLANTSGHYI